MLNNLKKNNQGFTIIEVMIVLAIAGLIMLIVFLAVPALQRSSRNSQRKSDVGQIGAAAQDVVSNNNGSITGLTNLALQAQLTNLAYYAAGSVTVAPATGTVKVAPDTNHVVVYTGGRCNTYTGTGGGLGASTSGANTRSIAVVYQTEPANNTCIDE